MNKDLGFGEGPIVPVNCHACQRGKELEARVAELEAHLEIAWGVIANAGHPALGDWDGMPDGWREVAEKWRDDWLKLSDKVEVEKNDLGI